MAINMNITASAILLSGPAILILPFISSLNCSESILTVPSTANTKSEKCGDKCN